MSLAEDIKVALADYLNKDWGSPDDIAEIIAWEDTTIYGGYCDTCAYETTGLDITYRDFAGKVKSFQYEGKFSDIISGL